MEKIYFDDDTYIWKGKLNKIDDNEFFLKEAYEAIESQKDVVKTDGYSYKTEWANELNFMGDFEIKSKLDEIVKTSINTCKELYNEKNLPYNKINTDAWVNVVRSVEPLQPNFYSEKFKYHIHTEISKMHETFEPVYTYVYYIQMPNVMDGEDGVLYFKGKGGIEYWVRPEVDDLIIMNADMPHAPNNAPNSTIDRIVLAGNVAFVLNKNKKSLI